MSNPAAAAVHHQEAVRSSAWSIVAADRNNAGFWRSHRRGRQT